MSNIVTMLQDKATHLPKKIACCLLANEKTVLKQLSYAELDLKARSVASYLQKKNLRGERILLVYPAGLDFVVAFIGCLYAGVIPVPVNCPSDDEFPKSFSFLKAIADDAAIAGVFTPRLHLNKLRTLATKKRFIIDIQQINNHPFYTAIKLNEKDIAYLQYTSGSTATPKGVVILHKNLTHSLNASIKAWGYTEDSITLNWAPHSHVYGLLCGILVPLYQGSRAILMSPADFIKRPLAWLEAISSMRATHAGCPNFGYDLCVNDTNTQRLAGLDLSCWKVAINGGETVQAETLSTFCKKFSPFGFNLKQFCPAFGMSELTGAIASYSPNEGPVQFNLSLAGLKNNKIILTDETVPHRKFVALGRLLKGIQAKIIDPKSLAPVEEDTIGEIWLSGHSVANGYWHKPAETKQSFNLTVKGSKKNYFRTGDLGFIRDGVLCITGRLKEVLVINGNKYYPHDLEKTIKAALSKFSINDTSIAFAAKTKNKDEIIVLQEISQHLPPKKLQELRLLIRSMIRKTFGIELQTVEFVQPKSIPKTASGKIQRKLCQEFYQNNKIVYLVSESTSHNEEKLLISDKGYDPDKKALLNDFINMVATVLDIPPAAINLTSSISEYAFDSINIIKMTAKLNEQYALNLSPATLFEYKTLKDFYNDLANILLQEKRDQKKLLPLPKAQLESEKDIAIIGMAGIFPGAQNIDEFWNNLIQEKDVIKAIPNERFDAQLYFGHSSESSKIQAAQGGFIDDITKFDASFFNIAPREAELIDPQQRLFLQTAWKTIEDAGYTPDDLAKTKTGVFVGVFKNDYAELINENEISDSYLTTGITQSILANRVSYYLNLQGPSEVIDTACSSSLVAIHHAVQAILTHDCELAIAGGVNVMITPTSFLAAGKAGMLSADGKCKTFDKAADGYVRGEGVAAILLKPLKKALADSDHIYGIIKGSAINHGGYVSSLTVPNPNAQADVIIEACQRANIAVDHINYIETHGTGTSLGDPIEINGLKKAFDFLSAKQTLGNRQKNYCGLGALKTHIGHLESAAGIASVVKVLLAMKNRMLPANRNFKEINPYIDLKNSPFFILNKTIPWKKIKIKDNEYPRLAGISSFGFGGTNAHIIMQEYEQEISSESSKKNYPYLITLSAKTDEALQIKLKELLTSLSLHENDMALENISFTLSVGRVHFAKRCAIISDSLPALIETLKKITQGEKSINYIPQTKVNMSFAERPVFLKLISEIYTEITQPLSATQYYEKLVLLAEFYIQGYDLEWKHLYSENIYYSRISLPTYPFARNYFWIATKNNRKNKFISDHEAIISTKLNSVPKEHSHVDHALIQHVSKVLKIAPELIDVSTALNDLGFDSISYKELSTRLEQQYKIEFSPAVFFTYTSIQALTAYITKILIPIGNNEHLKNNPAENQASSFSRNHLEPIAIIGMQAYFPQSKNLASFWQHLEAGDDLVTDIPLERWDWRQNYTDSLKNPGKTISKWCGSINDFDKFDAAFFNISAREANLMDPQHRLFMEIVWQTIEDAGYDPQSLSGQKTGVFVGVEFSEYQTLIAQQKIFHGFTATGNSHSLLANRVSYFLNLTGPSEAIDTACSSSLVAIHRAIQAIHHGECSLALAGGVSLMLNPDTVLITSQLGVLSSDGRCKTFDKSANGYVKGEGIAALLLKPLSQAEKDSDHIYAIIRGSAVNHGGKAQSLTAPNALAQAELLKEAYNAAHINPETITYIETHGTGTELGDPVEIEGLKAAFKELTSTRKKNYCGLGSVKTNMGHLEPASGIAGVIKVALSMKYGKLPAILHFKELNPYIHLDDSPFYIVTETKPWDRLINEEGEEIPRRAGVSSFGFGGTNAHVIIEEKINSHPATHLSIKPFYLISLSAKNNESLQQKIKNLYAWLIEQKNHINIEDLSYTLNQGRTHFNFRCAFIVSSIDVFISSLQQLINNENPNGFLQNKGQLIDSTSPLFTEIYTTTMQNLNAQTLSKDEYYKKLLVLADLYVKHYPIEWDLLHVNESKRRLASLPTYPFTKERYWYDLELISEKNITTATTIKPLKKSQEVNTSDLYPLTIEFLKNIFANKLHLSPEKIADNETYEVYGVDSLLGLEITNQLEEELGPIAKTLLYEKNQLQTLAQYLIKKFKSQLEKKFNITPSSLTSTEKTHPQIELPKIIETSSIDKSNDIAIIGISGTYPMASTLDELWDHLLNSRDCIVEIPKERWDYHDYPVQVGGKEKYYKYGGFIPDIDKFDPLFFNISPRDAILMDPQERLFMQTAWETLEDAGYTRELLQHSCHNNVGVFVGVTYNFYPLFIAEEWFKGNRIPLDVQLFSIANRVSYFLNLNGPSFIIDTACSSSLAAIHQACESIMNTECKMAIAGGVNLSLHPCKYHMLGSYSFMSDAGKCASFAEGGNGYVPSEGVGAVLLKPLADAIRDNDRIYGIIKASSMNHGGKTSGYTVPNPKAQADLIKKALAKAKINPRTISYVEAHGTGTALGDPIEIRGLQEAFEEYTEDKQFCSIGSVKSNIGHLESAAGISQLTKVLLQFKYKKLVPSIHSEKLNAFIDFNETPFYVQRTLDDWNPDNNLRRAAISSFGAGGTNVHLIVEEFKAQEHRPSAKKGPYLFVLSAINTDRLQEYTQKMLAFLTNQEKSKSDIELSTWLHNVCYTLQIGREPMAMRLAILSDSYSDLMNKLNKIKDNIQTQDKNIWINNPQQSSKDSDNISELIIQVNLGKLAELWTQGNKIPWDTLYSGNKLLIVSLPTYPFAKRTCWIEKTRVNVQASESVLTRDKTEKPKKNDNRTLIFSDFELGLLLKEYLHQSHYCFPGDHYEKFNETTFYINKDSELDLEQLFSELPISSFTDCLYLWDYNSEKNLLLLASLFKKLKNNNPINLFFIIRNNTPIHVDIKKLFNSQHINVQLISINKQVNLRDDAKYILDQVNHLNDEIAVSISTNLQTQKESEINPDKIKIIPIHRNEVMHFLLEKCANLLALEIRELDPEIPFQNYGMDSIIGINFVAELNIKYPDLLSPMDLYRYPTLNKLADYLIESAEPLDEMIIKPNETADVFNEENLLRDIAHLSEEEVAMLIEKELLELDTIL